MTTWTRLYGLRHHSQTHMCNIVQPEIVLMFTHRKRQANIDPKLGERFGIIRKMLCNVEKCC